MLRRLLSIVATLFVLAAAAPFASAQDDLTPTDNPATTGNASLANTAGPLPLIAIAGALLMVGGIREGLRRRTDG